MRIEHADLKHRIHVKRNNIVHTVSRQIECRSKRQNGFI